jgi:hypothetical protein
VKILVFIFLLLITPSLYAHNLDVETRSENGELVVQVWMGDDPGEQIEIAIYNVSGELRVNGQTNAEGVFRWQPIMEELLTINVYGEPGHEAEIELDADKVKSILTNDETVNDETVNVKVNQTAPNHSHELTSTRSNRQPLVNSIAGLALILSATGVWMAYRNQKRIQLLEQELNNRER